MPIVFCQEVHRRSRIDFGRELDGAEGPHCLDGDLGTELIDGIAPDGDTEYLIVQGGAHAKIAPPRRPLQFGQRTEQDHSETGARNEFLENKKTNKFNCLVPCITIIDQIRRQDIVSYAR